MDDTFDKVMRYILIGLLGLSLFGTSGPARADSKEIDFDYDIFLTDDTLAVWLDITPVLDQSRMEDLLAGLNISVAMEIKVERPRKLLFYETLTTARALMTISHSLTEDIYRLKLVNAGIIERGFKSQLTLSGFLSDSLVVKVAPTELLDEAAKLRLKLYIESKSHSSNDLSSATRPRGGAEVEDQPEEEFFESLFSSFLNLIGFGKTTYKIISPYFNLDELTSF
jgi:hypothetical protein